MPPIRSLAVLAALATLACASDAPTAPHAAGHRHASDASNVAAPSAAELAAVRAATAAYHRLDAALGDGFVNTRECVATPDAGMGVHVVHGARVGDGVLDATRPEVLVYEPQADGTYRLVAVEYMIPRPLWDAQHPGTRPTLFGQTFEDGPMDSYTLHVWVWRHNTAGMFAPFNPAVSCRHAR